MNLKGILNIFDYVVGLMLVPFQSFHPFIGLVGVCILITGAGMLIYRKLTDQEKLKQIQTQVRLRWMEMRLRHHTIGEIVRLQYEALAWNLQYLKTAFFPSMVIFIPVVLLLPALNARFEYIPARVGTIVSVEAILSSAEGAAPGKIKLEKVPEGLRLLEKDGRHGGKNVIGWYLRAIKNGVYTLKFSYGEKTLEKRVVISDNIPPLQAEIKPPTFLHYLYMVESSTLEAGIPIEALTVGYKKLHSPFGIFGWYPDWLSSFIIIFLILFFSLRPIIKVY